MERKEMPGIEPAEGQETMTAAEMPAEAVSGPEEAAPEEPDMAEPEEPSEETSAPKNKWNDPFRYVNPVV